MKNTLLLKIQALDQARQTLVRKMAESFSLDTQSVKITDLCGVLSRQDAEELLRLRQNLLHITEKLKNLQHKTVAVAQTSLRWINGSVATLTQMLTPSTIYNPTGKVENSKTFSGRRVERQA